MAASKNKPRRITRLVQLFGKDTEFRVLPKLDVCPDHGLGADPCDGFTPVGVAGVGYGANLKSAAICD